MVFLLCLKRTRQMQASNGISLRGWNTSAPVQPKIIYPLTKGEINYKDCPNYYFLKYIHRKKPAFEETKTTLQGTILHDAITSLCDRIKGIIFSSTEPEAEILDFDISQFSQQLIATYSEPMAKVGLKEDSILRKVQQIVLYELLLIKGRFAETIGSTIVPSSDEYIRSMIGAQTEVIVGESGLSLSPHSRLDGRLVESTIIDIKTGRKSPKHPIEVAGYALAQEASSRTAVNCGAVVYVWPQKRQRLPRIYIDTFQIDDILRRDFLNRRDEKLQIIKTVAENSPSDIVEDKQCQYCGFQKQCSFFNK